MIDNVLKVYRQADEIDRWEGSVAYLRYNATLTALARRYDTPLPRVVGAFAALSPNNDYMGNLRSLVTLLEGMRLGAREEDCTVSTYKACRHRAWGFLHGADFLASTRGPKTRNFYQNILRPRDPEPVTIDGHAVCAAIGKRMRMVEVVRTRFKYEEVAQSYREAAARVGLLPNQLQATVWFTWKRIHQVVYTPQLNAFMAGNQWGSLLDPTTLRPFPIGAANGRNKEGAGAESRTGGRGAMSGLQRPGDGQGHHAHPVLGLEGW